MSATASVEPPTPSVRFELTEATGAALRERTDTRTNLRNGHRPPHASVAAL
jgi:hypothetical protein